VRKKGISSSLPISCVLGKRKIMDLYGPGEMTSTPHRQSDSARPPRWPT